MKKILCAVLCLILAVSLFGCGLNAKKEVNLRDKLASVMVNDETLGIKGKYKTYEDIKDGSVDDDLIGTWKTADDSMSYSYTKEGKATATIKDYGDTESNFTCITSGEYKITCEETKLESTDENGNVTTTPAVSYMSYNVDNDVLYMTSVEETTDENMDSSQYALIIMYRADDNGSIDAALAKNSIALDSFAGTWTSDKGEITIADGTLKAGNDTYDISISDKGKLVVDKDGNSSEYSFNVSVRKEYDENDKTKATETTSLGLYYTGADEKDKPNLISVLDDWGEFQPNYYSSTFDLKQ